MGGKEKDRGERKKKTGIAKGKGKRENTS